MAVGAMVLFVVFVLVAGGLRILIQRSRTGDSLVGFGIDPRSKSSQLAS